MKPLLLYLLLVNALSFSLMLIDKRKAIKNRWRIPEKVLLGSAVAGGSLGCLLGMYAARHKTKHLKFSLGVPVIFAVQVIVLILIYTNTVG